MECPVTDTPSFSFLLGASCTRWPRDCETDVWGPIRCSFRPTSRRVDLKVAGIRRAHSTIVVEVQMRSIRFTTFLAGVVFAAACAESTTSPLSRSLGFDESTETEDSAQVTCTL